MQFSLPKIGSPEPAYFPIDCRAAEIELLCSFNPRRSSADKYHCRIDLLQIERLAAEPFTLRRRNGNTISHSTANSSDSRPRKADHENTRPLERSAGCLIVLSPFMPIVVSREAKATPSIRHRLSRAVI